MDSKKLGIIFIGAVIAAFLFGIFISNTLKTAEQEENMFDLISQQIKDEYYYDGLTATDEHEAFITYMDAVIRSYAVKFNDPYTRLAAIPRESSNPEEFVGIGVTLMYEKQGLRIVNVQSDGPAYKNLYPNDLIIGVKKNEMTYYFENLTQGGMMAYLAGSKDSEHTLLVLNPDQQHMDEPMITNINLVFATMARPSVYTLDLEEANIHYIRITQFNQQESNHETNQIISIGTNNLFKQVREELEARMDGNKEDHTLILDLRDNPGGSVASLHNIVQQLLPYTTEALFTLTPRVGNPLVYRGATGVDYDIRVLVNGSSASASEVLAAVLAEHGYTVYGNQTYGKNVYQSIARGSDGSYKPLKTINNIDYHLYMTLGIWTYGKDNINIAEQPIPYTRIDQSGYLAIENLFYTKEVGFDQVEMSLGNFQAFLNAHYDEDIRTDGYFDLATEELIERYQIDNDLDVTKKLDLATSRHMFDYWLLAKQDYKNDQQLKALINIIKNNG